MIYDIQLPLTPGQERRRELWQRIADLAREGRKVKEITTETGYSKRQVYRVLGMPITKVRSGR